MVEQKMKTTTLALRFLGKGQCAITHTQSGTQVTTDLASACGGQGRSFSAIELLAAAYSSCYLNAIENILQRNGIECNDIQLETQVVRRSTTNTLSALTLYLYLPLQPSKKLAQTLDRAASICPVRKSLSSEVDITLHIRQGHAPPSKK